MKTKSSISTALILSLFIFTGATCRKDHGTNIGPELLKTGVATIAGLHLVENPEALPDVKAGAAVICAVAEGTNLAPAVMALAIEKLDLRTPEGVIIMNGALGLYALAFNGLADTNAPAARPYSTAVCNGLKDAVVLSGAGGAASLHQPSSAVPTLTDWPQVWFK